MNLSTYLTAAMMSLGLLGRSLRRPLNDVDGRGDETARDVERERLFSAAVEYSNDAIITEALDGTITAWNPAAERMFGYSAQEAIGRNIELIVPEDRRDELRDILGKVARGERTEHFETVRVTRDGQRIDVSLGVSPVRSPAGDIIGAAKIAHDITSRLKTRAALLKEIEERRQIFETSLDLILVTDRKGKLLHVSPSSNDVLGYSPDEMVGHNAIEFIHLNDLDNTRREMRAARRGRAMRNFACRYVHKDGRTVTLHWTGGWSEPVQKHFFSGRDMTGQQRAEEGQHESERMARAIIDTALDAFVQMDEMGLILDWNPQAEAIFGWPRLAAVGRMLADLIVPQRHRAQFAQEIAQCLQGRDDVRGRRLEIEAQRRDGRELKIEISVTALHRRGGHVFNAFIRDLTDKIAAEEQLRQAQKMETVGQLTGGVAHDFNNILTVITGTIEILEQGVADNPGLAAIAHMIDDAATRGAELTQRLLAFARRQPLQPRNTDVNSLIIDAAKLLRPTLGERVEIESAFEEDAWPALVDPSQLTTALLNLALNARDAMPDGGKLVLETGNVNLDEIYARSNAEVAPGPYVMIAVSDTGHGIPAAIRDKVFDPFFTTKGAGKGTGLGLSMVYGFIKQSNGHIKIYSEEGHGTTIKLYLPRAGERADEASAAPAPIAVEGGAETILVVEDDPLVRNYVAAQLTGLGYTTLAAANASEALRRIDDGEAFDLLFTDVIMPGPINGRQLADEATRRRPSLKVLFTSGYTENAIVHHGRLDPGVLLLAKPYRKSDLARMVRIALAQTTAPATEIAERDTRRARSDAAE